MAATCSAEGRPSGGLKLTDDFESWRPKRGSVGVAPGFVSLVSLGTSVRWDVTQDRESYLAASSLFLEALVLFRLGTGILHSIEKATQLVHGTLDLVNRIHAFTGMTYPSDAASQRTFRPG